MQVDFQELMSRSPNPYLLMDRDLTLVWMNDAYLAVTMRKREKLVGRPLFEAFPSEPGSESHRLLNGSLRKVLASGEPDELALIRYDIDNPSGGVEVLYWSATHTPLKDENGEVVYILQHTVNVTELHRLRKLRDEMGVVERARQVQHRNLDLAKQSEHLRALFAQAPGFAAFLTGPDHRFTVVNDAYRELVGRSDLLGLTVAEALPEVVGQGFIDLLDEVYESGEAFVGQKLKVLLSPDSTVEDTGRYLDFVYQPIFEEGGKVSGIFVLGHDVTEQVEADERQMVLINELNHRVKNTLAIVQGLAVQSFRQIPDSAQARATFDARLAALAAAHSLLTEKNWESAGLHDMVRNSLVATIGTDTERFSLSGPDLPLPPQTAVSLAMIIHEMSTNAIKYGALSNDTGQVDISWQIEEREDAVRLTLQWAETGGPPVEPPARGGFGKRLIERGLNGDTAGAVDLRFEPAGVTCSIVADLQLTEAA